MKKLLRCALLVLLVPWLALAARASVHETNDTPGIIRTLTIHSLLWESSDWGYWEEPGWFDVTLYYGESYDSDDQSGSDPSWGCMWGYEETVIGISDSPDPDYETWECYDEPQEWEYGDWEPVGSTPADTWEDEWCDLNRTKSRWHDTGEVSNLGGYRNQGGYWEEETEYDWVLGTKLLNWRSFDEYIEDWHTVSDWTPDASEYWEDEDVPQTREWECAYQTGWRNDRGDEVIEDSGVDTETDSQTVKGLKPLNRVDVDNYTEWEECGDWQGGDPALQWEDRFVTGTWATRRIHRHSWSNDRGDSGSTEEPETGRSESREIPGTKPLNEVPVSEYSNWEALTEWQSEIDPGTVWEDRWLTQTRLRTRIHIYGFRNDRDGEIVEEEPETGEEVRQILGWRLLNWRVDDTFVFLGEFNAPGATWQGDSPNTKVVYATVTQTLARVLRYQVWRINDRGEPGDFINLGLTNDEPASPLVRTLAGTRVPGSVQIAGPGGTTLNVVMSGGGVSTGPIAIGGSTVTLGTNSGTIVLSTGATISVSSSGGVTVTGVPGVPSGPLSGTVDLGAAGSLEIDSSGHATLSVGSSVPLLGGATIKAGVDGAGSIVFPSGAGITVAANGRLGLVLPRGTDPAIVKAVDILGAVLQPNSGAVISVRSVVGAIVPLPTSGVLADIDVGITGQGQFEIGVKVDDSHTFWFDVETAPRIDLDIIKLNGTEMAEDKEDTEGAILQVNIDDDDDDGGTGPNATPDMQDVDGVSGGQPLISREDDLLRVLLHKPTVSGASNLTYKLHFDSSKLAVWKKDDKTQPVQSDTTTFDASDDTLVYVEGLSPSSSDSGEIVTLRLYEEGQSVAYDSIKITVARMVFALVGHGTTGETSLRQYLNEHTKDGRVDPYIVRGATGNGLNSWHSVFVWNTEKGAKLALGAQDGIVVYDGHSSYGIGMAFSAGLTGISSFMNVGQDLVTLNWPDMRGSIEGHPNLSIADAEYGDDTTTVEQFDPWLTSDPSAVVGAQGTHAATRLFSTPQVGGTHLHLQRGSQKPLDAHYATTSGERMIVAKGGKADLPTLRYSKLYLDACSSGQYYYPIFNHGTLFYTYDLCESVGTTKKFIENVIGGKTNDEILDVINDDEPVNDYHNF